MVYFKRKSVQVPAPKYKPVSDDTPVWVIEPTLEYFVSYDDYMRRLDFYNQKKFICELTGHSCLTFFQALERETREARLVVQNFPELLKEPILRLVQFSTTSRLDQLVDEVYSKLRREYFLGETVYTKYREQRVRVVVREKAHFNDITLPNGELQRGHSRYRVELFFDPATMLDVESGDLSRDRKVFNKVTLRTFIKHAASRENWSGCPWIVKSKYTEKYRIPVEMPSKLKLLCELRSRADTPSKADSMFASGGDCGSATGSTAGDFDVSTRDDTLDMATPEPKRRRARNDGGSSLPPTPIEDLLRIVTLEARKETAQVTKLPEWSKEDSVEDGRLVGILIEIWSFLNVYNDLLVLEPISFDDLVNNFKDYECKKDNLLVDEVFSALFSQFVEEGEDELAIPLPLQEEPPRRKRRGRKPKIRVEEEEEEEAVEETAQDDEEGEDGEDGEDDEDDEDGDDDEKEDTEEAEGEPSRSNGIRNHSRTPQSKDATPDQQETERPVAPPKPKKVPKTNRGADYLELQKTPWLDRIGKRQFSQGGWQTLLICTLHSVAYMRDWNETIERILKIMAPLDRPVNLGHAVKGFAELDFSDKILALHIVCRVLYTSGAVRQFMEKRSEELTRVRKDRAEYSRQSKLLADTIKGLKEERNALMTKFGSDHESLLESNKEYKELFEKQEEAQSSLPETMRQIRRTNDLLAHYEAHRIRYLGKDRFFNRYWWMEANGMERTNEDDLDEDAEDTARHFLMGRLWVQGPTEEDTHQFLQNEKFDETLTATKQEIHQSDFDTRTRQIDEIRTKLKAEHEARILREKHREVEQERREKHRREAAEKSKAAALAAKNKPRGGELVILDSARSGEPRGGEILVLDNLRSTPSKRDKKAPVAPIAPATAPAQAPNPPTPTHRHVVAAVNSSPHPQVVAPPQPVPVPVQHPGQFPVGYPAQGQYGVMMYSYGGQIPMMVPQYGMYPGMQMMQPQVMGPMGAPVMMYANAQGQMVPPHMMQPGQVPGQVPMGYMIPQQGAHPGFAGYPQPVQQPMMAIPGYPGYPGFPAQAPPQPSGAVQPSQAPAPAPQPQAVQTPVQPQAQPQPAETEKKDADGDKMDVDQPDNAAGIDRETAETVVEEPTLEERDADVTMEDADATKDADESLADADNTAKEPEQETADTTTENLDVKADAKTVPKTEPAGESIDDAQPVENGKANGHSAEQSNEKAVEVKLEAKDEEEELNLPPYPEPEEVEPTSAMEMKLQGEVDPLTSPNEWRYYETPEQFDTLLKSLLRSGVRESRLAEKLTKSAGFIRGSMKARQKWLEADHEPWTNELAMTEMGHHHCRRTRKRR